jgi:ketosteroid isomerase-like protein
LNRLDAGTLASLYSRNVFFFGSKSSLYRGNEGVAAYFNALPRWSSPTVQFTDRTTAQVNPDLINFAGVASFVVDEGAAPLSVKITWVIAREDGDWRIVSHHVSSLTPLL